MPSHHPLLLLMIMAVLLFNTQIHGQTGIVEKTKTIVESVEGRKYEVIRISKKTSDSITFSHPGGVVTFRANELTIESRELLGFASYSQSDSKPKAIDLSKPLPNFTSTPQNSQGAITTCTSCRGHKVIACTSCMGSGFGQDTQKYEPCSKCGGLGKYSKELKRTIDRGALKHNQSYVYGHSEVICEKCKGQGKFGSNARTYCSVCNGRGQMKCPKCN